MANAKQAGANLANTEFYTGRCEIRCEQCFVNFGIVGSGTLSGMLHPSPGVKSAKWIAYAKANGWRHKKLGTKHLKPGDKGYKTAYKNLEFPILDQAAAWSIPRMPDPISFMGNRKRPQKYAELHSSMKFMLRVCSMSDSSTSPLEWCEEVQKAWGDYCFFNTSINGALTSEEHFQRAYHKVVITVNGGYQQVPPVPQYGVKGGIDARRHVLGSMSGERLPIKEGRRYYGLPGERNPMDFFHPVTLATASNPAFAQYEGAVKWYRLRALPTIAPAFEPNTPFVVTQMRFRTIAHLLEFARKYDCKVRVYCEPNDKKTQETFEVFRPHLRTASIHASNKRRARKKDVEEPVTFVEIWNTNRENRSPRRREHTLMRLEGGYYKAAGEEFSHYQYVCDRFHGSCVACGLCASLDGTQPGDVNALNVMKFKNGNEVLLGPETAMDAYLRDYIPEEANYYAALFDEALEDGWIRNPGGNGNLDKIERVAREVAKYVTQGDTPDSGVNESWNTHEDALTLAAFCAFSVLREAKHAGLDKDDALSAMYEWLIEAGDGVDITIGLEDLDTIWDGTSRWNEMFGAL